MSNALYRATACSRCRRQSSTQMLAPSKATERAGELSLARFGPQQQETGDDDAGLRISQDCHPCRLWNFFQPSDGCTIFHRLEDGPVPAQSRLFWLSAPTHSERFLRTATTPGEADKKRWNFENVRFAVSAKLLFTTALRRRFERLVLPAGFVIGQSRTAPLGGLFSFFGGFAHSDSSVVPHACVRSNRIIPDIREFWNVLNLVEEEKPTPKWRFRHSHRNRPRMRN
jgi:hypothetical protein